MKEESSPCKNCKNHLNGIDKRLCLGSCKRLAAYRTGKDWTKEEVSIVTEGKDLVEDIKNNGFFEPNTDPDVESDLIGDIEEEQVELTDIEKPGLVKRITPKANWKKAMPQKKKKSETLAKIEKCLYCGRFESDDNKLRRGLCISPCYGAWFAGRILHPEYGVFKKLTSKKVVINRKKKRAKEASIMTPQGSLPDTKMKQKVARTVKANSKDTDICLNTVELDLSKYPQIMKLIYRMAVDLSLPVTHIVVTLLAEALANRSK